MELTNFANEYKNYFNRNVNSITLNKNDMRRLKHILEHYIQIIHSMDYKGDITE